MVSTIGIVVSTTRQGRFADKPAQWLLDLGASRSDMQFEIIDLRDYPLPLFDQPMSPAWAPVSHPVATRLSSRMAALDGFIFLTAEYNHSISGALKNALVYLYFEMNKKPAAFVGYGGVGGARAVEQLRLMCIELQMSPTRSAVHIGAEPYLGVVREGKALADYSFLADSAKTMLDELAWWSRTLKAGRDLAEAPATAAA